MKFIRLIAIITFISACITSCGKKNNLGKMIPANAAVVVDLNAKSLLSKLSWEEIKKSHWFGKIMADSSIPATSKTFIDDPSKTGIDLNSDIVFFVLNPGTNGQTVLEGSLKDSKAFADLLAKMHPSAAIHKEGELNIFKTNESVIGWNNERFLLISNTDHFHQMHNEHLQNDSINNTTPLPVPSSDNLVGICKNIFNLSHESSLYENEKFAKLMEDGGDIHVWLNANEIYKSSGNSLPGMAGMIKLDKFLEDNISTTTINFMDGKITANHKQYFGKELTDIVKKSDGTVNTDMIKRLSSTNIAGIFSLHFTPANLLEIIKLTGLDGFINLFMAQQGLSLDDIIKATKGDILFSVSDITLKNDTSAVTAVQDTAGKHYQKPDAVIVFAVAIGDKAAFNKLISLGKTMGKDLTKKSMFQKADDKYFVVSNSQDAVNKYLSGTQSNPDFLAGIKDHSIGGFVDIQMILKTLQQQLTKDSTDKILYEHNIAMWNNFYLTGGEFKDGGIVSSATLNLLNKTTNSLQQLNQYMDDNANLMIEKRKQDREAWRKDSTLADTDSITVAKKKLHNNPVK